MRRLAIPDIHGCSKTVRTLVENIQLNKNDQLFFLGDYIDRGHDSAGVLDFIIELKEKGYRIFPLRGNHEHNLVDSYKEYDHLMFTTFVAKMNKSANLLDEHGHVFPKYLNFIDSLPFYYELDDFWLVHAGFKTASNDMLTDYTAMIDTRRFEYSEHLLKGKTVLHGHQVTNFPKISAAIEQRSKIIPLDNGCVYNRPHKIHDHTQLGQLLCFNLDTWELTSQPNVDS